MLVPLAELRERELLARVDLRVRKYGVRLGGGRKLVSTSARALRRQRQLTRTHNSVDKTRRVHDQVLEVLDDSAQLWRPEQILQGQQVAEGSI